MKRDDTDIDGGAVVQEIMEAGLVGALGGYAARKAAKGAAAAVGGLGSTKIGGRIKGVTRGASALTKIEHDFQAYMGSKQGFSRKPPTEQDLLDFTQHTYGVDAHQLLRNAKSSLNLGQADATAPKDQSGGTQAQPQAAPTAAAPASAPEAPQAEPDTAAQGEPSVGRARKAEPAPPQTATSPTPKVAPTPAPSAQAAAPQAAPEQPAAAAPAPSAPASPEKPARVFRRADGSVIDMKPEDFVPDRHDPKQVQFDAPGLQLGVNDTKSNRQQRDDERLGRDEGPKAIPKDPNRKPKIYGRNRTESLDFPDVTFSQILAEKEAQTAEQQPEKQPVNTQAVVNDKKMMKALASAFFKKLAHEVAATPQSFKHFMTMNKGGHHHTDAGYGTYAAYGAKPGYGTMPNGGAQGAAGTGASPNRTDANTIDRAYLNNVLTNVLKVPGNPLATFEQGARGVDPNQIAKTLVSNLDHDVAYKILAALVATLAR